MSSKKKVWNYGNFYAKEKNFLKKPKYVWEVLYNLIKTKKNKRIIFWDIGCAEGSLLKFLERQFINWTFHGSDNNPILIKAAKKNTLRSNIFYEDLFKKLKNKNIKANIIYSGAVYPIYEDIELFLKKMIERTHKSGDIFIQGVFNPHPADMLIKLRDCTKKNFYKDKIELTGWHRFSFKTIGHILKREKRVKSHKFITIKYPKNIVVKKRKFMRAWTEIIRNKVYFMNETNMLEDSQILHIKLK